MFYKRFLLTPFSPIFGAIPVVSTIWWMRKQRRVYKEICEETIGHLSDRELLEFELKINPKKVLVYEQILKDDDKRREREALLKKEL